MTQACDQGVIATMTLGTYKCHYINHNMQSRWLIIQTAVMEWILPKM